MGMPRFRRGKICEQTVREMTDVIGINKVNANDDQYEVRLAA
jgi:hypothetical protein